MRLDNRRMKTLFVGLIHFINFVQHADCTLRQNISSCNDESLFKRLDSKNTFTALASLPGTIYISLVKLHSLAPWAF